MEQPSPLMSAGSAYLVTGLPARRAPQLATDMVTIAIVSRWIAGTAVQFFHRKVRIGTLVGNALEHRYASSFVAFPGSCLGRQEQRDPKSKQSRGTEQSSDQKKTFHTSLHGVSEVLSLTVFVEYPSHRCSAEPDGRDRLSLISWLFRPFLFLEPHGTAGP